MSERYAASIEIGGRLSLKRLPRLLKAIAHARVASEWGDALFTPTSAEELLNALHEGRLWLCDDEARGGEFPDLEKVCRQLGLGYTRWTDAGTGGDAEVVEWRPGMSKPLCRIGSNAGKATFVPTDEVRKALAHLEAQRTGQAKALLRKLCPVIPELPPFVIR